MIRVKTRVECTKSDHTVKLSKPSLQERVHENIIHTMAEKRRQKEFNALYLQFSQPPFPCKERRKSSEFSNTQASSVWRTPFKIMCEANRRHYFDGRLCHNPEATIIIITLKPRRLRGEQKVSRRKWQKIFARILDH